MEGIQLTVSLLLSLGFRREGRDFMGRLAYRLTPARNERNGHYFFDMQVSLFDDPVVNPNSGLVFLYHPGIKDAHTFTQELIGTEPSTIEHITWQEGDMQGGVKFTDIPARLILIANGVRTLERLNAIYCALTDNPPLEPNESLRELMEIMQGDGH